MDIPYGLFSSEELENTDTLTDETFWKMIFNIPESTTPDTSIYADNITYNNSISIVTSDKNNLIYKAKGEIILKNNKYYWVECTGNSFDENYRPHLQHPYLISEEYYTTIETLFLATHQQ